MPKHTRAARAKAGQVPTMVDLFAGAGGVTAGYKRAGFSVIAAVEVDRVACESYRANHPEVTMFQADVRTVRPTAIRPLLGNRTLDVLAACSPCGSYSTLRRGRRSRKDKDLALIALDFVQTLRPNVVVLENVPQLQSDPRFARITAELGRLGYALWWDVLDAYDYGVPQHRKRLILIGSRRGTPAMPRQARVRRTVRDAIQAIDRRDSLHRVPHLNSRILERIRAVPKNGGSRDSLPPRLQLACHRRLTASAATNVYGRMSFGSPAPTLTTRCTTPACGRFVHPTLNRPITLREAACLQSFPRRYSFVGSREQVERQIGNAVPVELARRIATHIRRG